MVLEVCGAGDGGVEVCEGGGEVLGDGGGKAEVREGGGGEEAGGCFGAVADCWRAEAGGDGGAVFEGKGGLRGCRGELGFCW